MASQQQCQDRRCAGVAGSNCDKGRHVSRWPARRRDPRQDHPDLGHLRPESVLGIFDLTVDEEVTLTAAITIARIREGPARRSDALCSGSARSALESVALVIALPVTSRVAAWRRDPRQKPRRQPTSNKVQIQMNRQTKKRAAMAGSTSELSSSALGRGVSGRTSGGTLAISARTLATAARISL